MPDALNWDQIQGNITPGFRSGHQVLLFFGFPQNKVENARCWLGKIQRMVATSREVNRYNDIFRLIKHRAPDDPEATPEQIQAREAEVYRFLGSVLVNVGISYDGFVALDARWHDRFPDTFKHGLFRDDGPLLHRPAFDGERVGRPAAEAHVMLVIGADDPKDLEDEAKEQWKLAEECGLDLKFEYYVGHRLPGMAEHFGFRDSVSQPKLAGPLDSLGRVVSTIAPGEFILGYRDEDQIDTGFVRLLGEPFWATDGSYLVFLKLYQDVWEFRKYLKDQAGQPGPTPEQVAARMVGRWQSGARLGCPLEAKDPGWQNGKAAEVGLSEFADDPKGERFSLNSHIRKVFPREITVGSKLNNPSNDEARQRRLLRRGITYGPVMKPEATKRDNNDRGLLFLAYQANIHEQFEHIAQEWIAASNFPSGSAGDDPLLRGLFKPGPAARTRAENAGVELSVAEGPKFVTLCDGGYFFAPSLRALAYLANPAGGWRE
jgi:Dyp-type peroxidase family